MSKIMGTLALTALVLGSMTTSASGQATCYDFTARDKRVAANINTVRQSHDLRMVNLDPELSRVARKHTSEMIAAGQVRHTPDDVLGQRVTRWNTLGESVLRGDDVDELMHKLRNRDGHRANLLEPSYRYIGVSVIRHDSTLWATVVYEATRDPGTTLQMPSC